MSCLLSQKALITSGQGVDSTTSFVPFQKKLRQHMVMYFTEVCWLSRGNVLKRFFELRKEVKRFMEDGRIDVPEFDDPKWVMDLAFLVDITQELNILNLKLQGPGVWLESSEVSVQVNEFAKPLAAI
ncbi:hypothetical protein QQF64_006497 [Cirrhinus molitorella]|uniref:Uncharacterized protein n=1 Tax=Cirrhinus molitorella TaxID=172907 RepID=A0ABR3MF89_9TELE